MPTYPHAPHTQFKSLGGSEMLGPLRLVSPGVVCERLGPWELSPGVHDERQGDDHPQRVHEDKVEPEVDGVSHLTVSVSIPVLGVEVEHGSVQLACRNQ